MARIWIVGELNVDMIVRGNDVTPQPGREKLVDECELVLGSSSAITAAVLAGLGHDVRMVSIVGDDLFGQYVLRELRKTGIDTQYVKISKSTKTGVTVSLSDGEDRSLLTFMGSIAAVTPEVLPDDLFLTGDHLHFGSYFLQTGMQGHWKEMLEGVHKVGMTTSFDTGWDVSEQWRTDELHQILGAADYFFPNDEEFYQLTGTTNLEQGIKRLPSPRGTVVIKRGGEGCLLVNSEGKTISRQSFRVNPIDTTGAGDSFNAGFIHGLVSDMDLTKTMDFANASGALATLRVGGAGNVPSVSEVKSFIQSS